MKLLLPPYRDRIIFLDRLLEIESSFCAKICPGLTPPRARGRLAEEVWVWWGQLIAGWMLPPNNEVLCSLVKDCTNWEVFLKCSPVLKQTSEEKENYHGKRKEKISILSVAGLIFSYSLIYFQAAVINCCYKATGGRLAHPEGSGSRPC